MYEGENGKGIELLLYVKSDKIRRKWESQRTRTKTQQRYQQVHSASKNTFILQVSYGEEIEINSQGIIIYHLLLRKASKW